MRAIAWLASVLQWHVCLAEPIGLFTGGRSLHETEENSKAIADPYSYNCVSSCIMEEYMSVLINPEDKQNCRIERDFIRCLNACPQSKMLDIMSTSRNVGKIICMDDYEDYQKYRGCIEVLAAGNPTNGTVQDCPASGDESVMDFIADPFAPNGLRHHNDSARVERNLIETCQNYECNLKLNLGLVKNHCGEAASVLWSKLLKARVKSAIDVYVALRLINAVPQCDSLLNGKGAS